VTRTHKIHSLCMFIGSCANDYWLVCGKLQDDCGAPCEPSPPVCNTLCRGIECNTLQCTIIEIGCYCVRKNTVTAPPPPSPNTHTRKSKTNILPLREDALSLTHTQTHSPSHSLTRAFWASPLFPLSTFTLAWTFVSRVLCCRKRSRCRCMNVYL